MIKVHLHNTYLTVFSPEKTTTIVSLETENLVYTSTAMYNQQLNDNKIPLYKQKTKNNYFKFPDFGS